MHKYEAAALDALRKKRELTLQELMAGAGLGKDEALWAVENLAALEYVRVDRTRGFSVSISDEGKRYVREMLPEERLLKALKAHEVKVGKLSEEERIGMQWCIKLGLAAVSSGTLRITAKGKEQHIPTHTGSLLHELSENPERYAELSKTNKQELDTLLKRGLITVRERSGIENVAITPKGLKAEITKDEGLIDAVTRDVIVNRAWTSKGFKKYDVSLKVEKEPAALRHPMRRLIRDIKQTYLGMGFTEISGPIIEPSFWVFDSLFVPQDHPAREAQDTFYLSKPESIAIEGDDYVKAIRKTHTKSWRSVWKQEEAERAVLRSHTTSVTVRYISSFVKSVIAENAYPELPLKLFSVGRVFRNENIDYKHLIDFYQHDGIIIGKDLTLANLFDTLITFYDSFGIKIRFKPAYFPFVEPGVEVYAYYERAGEWVEMGGAGVIRSEVTSLSRKKLTVLAWGPGVERMLLLKDPSVGSITELYNNGIGWLRSRKV